MPVLVRHPDHTDDCPVCAHAAIEGMGTTVPKTPEEHAATCCSPERIAARQEFEQRAMDALEPRVEDVDEDEESYDLTDAEREELAAEARQRAQAFRAAHPPTKPSLSLRVRRARRNARRRVDLLKDKVVPPKPVPGYEQTTWFENADPVVADLFTSAQSPSRLDRLRAWLRRS